MELAVQSAALSGGAARRKARRAGDPPARPRLIMMNTHWQADHWHGIATAPSALRQTCRPEDDSQWVSAAGALRLARDPPGGRARAACNAASRPSDWPAEC